MLTPKDVAIIKAEIDRLEKARKDCSDSGLTKWIEAAIEKQKRKLASDSNPRQVSCGVLLAGRPAYHSFASHARDSLRTGPQNWPPSSFVGPIKLPGLRSSICFTPTSRPICVRRRARGESSAPLGTRAQTATPFRVPVRTKPTIEPLGKTFQAIRRPNGMRDRVFNTTAHVPARRSCAGLTLSADSPHRAPLGTRHRFLDRNRR